MTDGDLGTGLKTISSNPRNTTRCASLARPRLETGNTEQGALVSTPRETLRDHVRDQGDTNCDRFVPCAG